MAKELWRLSDEQWERIRDCIPTHEPGEKGGRPRASDKKAFQGILWVLRTGAQWGALPRAKHLFASYATCWRRLDEWSESGVFVKMFRVFLGELNERDQIEWKESFVDGTFASAKKGVLKSGKRSEVRALSL